MRQSQLLVLLAASLIAALTYFLMSSPAAEQGLVTPVEQAWDGPTLAKVNPVEPPAARQAEAERAPVAAREEIRAGLLIGRVVDEDGLPIAGARFVAAGTAGLPLNLRGPSGMPMVRGHNRLTGPDGRFALEGVGGGLLRMGVLMDGFLFEERANIRFSPEEGLDLGDWVLERGASLEGHVVNEIGVGLAGARLSKRPTTSGASYLSMMGPPLAVTDAEGWFRIEGLEVGPWKVSVASPGRPLRSFEGHVKGKTEVRKGLRFELPSGSSIAGRMTGIPTGEAVSVMARPQSGGSGPMKVHTGVVEENGTFLLEGCKGSVEYLISANVGGYQRSKELLARPGQEGIVLEWLAPSGVRFRVVDEADEPLERFKVRFGYGSKETLRVDQEVVMEHPGGLVELPDVGLRGKHEGPFGVSVELLGYELLEAQLPVGTGAVVDGGVLRLRRASILAVSVVDAVGGEAVQHAMVSLRRSDLGLIESLKQKVDARADELGKVELSAVPGVGYVLEVRVGQFAPWKTELQIDPSGGRTEQVVRLGRGGLVRVKAVAPQGVPLAERTIEARWLTPAGAMPASDRQRVFSATSRVTDADGVAIFRHLVSGEHQFKIGQAATAGSRFRGGGFSPDGETGWTSVEVSEGGEYELIMSAEQSTSVAGAVTENGEPLEGAQVDLFMADTGQAMGGSVFQSVGGSTDADGHFQIDGVIVGHYNMRIRHKQRSMKHEQPVEVVAGANRLDVALDVATVEGHVLDGEGHPVVGAFVSGKTVGFYSTPTIMAGPDLTNSGGGPHVDMQSVTDSNGLYRLRGVMAGKQLRISAKADYMVDGISAAFTVEEDELRSNVDLVLKAAGVVVVELPAKMEGKMMTVKAQYLGPEVGVPDIKVSNLELVRRIAGLTPGTWSITAFATGHMAPVPEKLIVEVLAGEVQTLAYPQ